MHILIPMLSINMLMTDTNQPTPKQNQTNRHTTADPRKTLSTCFAGLLPHHSLIRHRTHSRTVGGDPWRYDAVKAVALVTRPSAPSQDRESHVRGELTPRVKRHRERDKRSVFTPGCRPLLAGSVGRQLATHSSRPHVLRSRLRGAVRGATLMQPEATGASAIATALAIRQTPAHSRFATGRHTHRVFPRSAPQPREQDGSIRRDGGVRAVRPHVQRDTGIAGPWTEGRRCRGVNHLETGNKSDANNGREYIWDMYVYRAILRMRYTPSNSPCAYKHRSI